MHLECILPERVPELCDSIIWIQINDTETEGIMRFWVFYFSVIYFDPLSQRINWVL